MAHTPVSTETMRHRGAAGTAARARAAVAVAALFMALAPLAPAAGSQPPPGGAAGGEIRWSAQIPAPPDSMPVLKLSTLPAPIDLVNRLLAATRYGAALAPLSGAPFLRTHKITAPRDVLGVVEDNHLKAYVDRRTGEAAIYPSLAALKPLQSVDERRAVTIAEELFRSGGLLIADDTRIAAAAPQVLNGETVARQNDRTQVTKEKAPYLVYVPARRFVGDYAVYGPGSRAVVAVGNDGVVEGLSRAWKAAKTVGKVRPVRSAAEVKTAIERQLAPAAKQSVVEVDGIELAYYDGNRGFLQPVYRFTARVHHEVPGQRSVTADDFVIGFVPLGKPREPVPSLLDTGGPRPKQPGRIKAPPTRVSSADAAPRASLLDPIVGRYVVRDDSQGWVDDANAFWHGIAGSWLAPFFTNAQYYWAEPRLFTNQKNSFINATNLAEIEVHGDWWLFSTEKNCCDLVNINGDIPSPGYGPSANGALADWVIHSCEVVPGPDDTATWPDPWWTVFGGVRNVVGYRTIMYISDGAGGPYGASLAHLAPVVSSWLSDVSSLSAYSGGPKAKAHGGIDRPMGRASTISACGRDGDSVLAVSPLARADCLVVWWFPD